MGFASYLEDINDRKAGSELPPLPDVFGRPSYDDVPQAHVDLCLARITQKKQDAVMELGRLQTRLKELNQPSGSLHYFIRSLVNNPRGQLSPNGKKREAVRRQMHNVPELINQLENSERMLERKR